MRALPPGLAFVLFAAAAAPTDWPQLRGPNRDGISTETGLLPAWPAGGPPVAWTISGLGNGYSSPSIADGRLFVQGQRRDRQYVFAFDAASGRRLWETPTAPAFHHPQAGDGPRGTTTIDAGRVYASTADGTLVCLDAATGSILWSQNLFQKFHAPDPMWGASDSPLIDGDHLIMMPGAPTAAVVSLDKRSGAVQWKAANDEAGYAAALVVEIGGVRQVIALTGQSVMSVEESNGTILWRYPRIITKWPGMAAPIYHDGYLFVSTAFDADCALLQLGPRSMSEVYFKHKGMNYFYYWSSVLVGGTLYGYSDTVLTALDFKTGNVLWKSRSVGKGSVVYADRHLYLLSEDGVMGLAEVTPEKYSEISRFDVQVAQAPARTPPVIANGHLYIRVQDNLICYDIRARRAPPPVFTARRR